MSYLPRWLKWILIAVAFMVTGTAAFYAGGVMGFGEGFASQMGLAAPADAAYTVGVLEALRAGRTESAIDLLEVKLDSHIVEWVLVAEESLHFDWLGLKPAGGRLAARVLSYRSEHPPEDAIGRSAVERLHAIDETFQQGEIEPAVPADAAKGPPRG